MPNVCLAPRPNPKGETGMTFGSLEDCCFLMPNPLNSQKVSLLRSPPPHFPMSSGCKRGAAGPRQYKLARRKSAINLVEEQGCRDVRTRHPDYILTLLINLLKTPLPTTSCASRQVASVLETQGRRGGGEGDPGWA